MYEIEQYELHAMKYRVEADSEAAAIMMLLDGDGVAVDDTLEFIEVASDYGLPVEEFNDLAKELLALDVIVGECVIPSIRSIALVK